MDSEAVEEEVEEVERHVVGEEVVEEVDHHAVEEVVDAVVEEVE